MLIMADKKHEKFYVGIGRKDGRAVGHVITFGSPPSSDALYASPKPE
jgi:hypothetical protein